MIRTVDISKLLTSGDLSDLAPVSGLSLKFRLAQAADDALAIDPGALVSDTGSKASKSRLADLADPLFSRNKQRSGHDDGTPSSVIKDSDGPLLASSRVDQYFGRAKYGKAYASMSAVGFIANLGKQSLTAYGWIGNASLSLDGEGTVALLANQGLTTDILCAGSIANSTYQIVDYRWGPDVTNVWYASGQPSPFPNNTLTVGDRVWLAVRIRLSEGAVLLGNDWSIQFQNPAGNWVSITNSSKTFKFQDYSAMSRVMPPDFNSNEINWSHKVTRPGPGNPVTGYKIYIATQDDQSSRVTNAAPANSEVEVWFPFEMVAPTEVTTSGTPLNFRIISSNESTRVISGNSVIEAGWFDCTIEVGA